MTRSRITEIDLLRFIAAMMVVFFHYSFRGYAADGLSAMPYSLLAPAAKYGYLGVQLFFMISGFVILMTATGGGLRHFVISRATRLYPAFWACCTLTYIVSLWIGGPRYAAPLSDYLVNMSLLGGFFGVRLIDGVYWSLFVELQFYALVGLVILLGRADRLERLLLCWLVATIVATLLPADPLRRLLLTSYSAFFIAGGVFYFIWFDGATFVRLAAVATCWALTIVQTVRSLLKFEQTYNVTMSVPVVVVVVTSFFVVMLLTALRYTGYFGRRQWALAGALTYPLYLVHQNVGFMVFNQFYPAVDSHVLFWGMVIASLGIAYLVHVSIEKRFGPVLKAGLTRLADAGEHTALRMRRALRA